MITYSRDDMRRQLISDHRLWRRFPGAAIAILWPIETVLLGWETGRWLGPTTVVAVALASEMLPSRLPANIYLVDVLDRLLRLPLGLAWLVLAWHLSVREPVLPVLGFPFAGAAIFTALAWLLAHVLILGTRLLVSRTAARGGATDA